MPFSNPTSRKVSGFVQLRGKTVALIIAAAVLVPRSATAAAPCDFKGVSVGDATTPSALMKAFGIKAFKMNPEHEPFDEMLKLAKEVGLSSASEIANWKLGPYCDNDSCRIPYGVGVGNSDSPVGVFVSLRKGRVAEIDVYFNTAFWDDIVQLLDAKYGATWTVERDPYFVITNLKTKKSETVERITLQHKTGGKNPRTGDTCQIWAVNYDIVFQHHDPLGSFHSLFAIKLNSKNF